ncbi:MAG: putative glycoside hydrolase, partial [bacterium]|nr:putative glycoside hydrolase [bacterium]
PSDGDNFDASYPFWDEETPLQIIIASFFAYLHGELEEGITSVDLFGLAAANTWDDMGIGQILEDAFPYFDFISPMVYPSHFAPGFKGLERPDEHPYEIVRFSMARAKDRLDLFQSQNNGTGAKLRPWLQYFDLAGSRVRYTPEVIREQILGARDGLKEEYGGYLLWNSANVYPAAEVQEIVFGSPPDAFKEDTSLLE